jgi:hypothetical protein
MHYQMNRRELARKIRQDAAELAYLREQAISRNNDDETALPNYIGNYTKGLPHNHLGEVNREAYQALLKALASGNPADFAKIPLSPESRPLVNPQAGFAFDLEGPDARSVAIAPAPSVTSAQAAAEMGELYWMALLRDVHFKHFDRHIAAEEQESSRQMVVDAANSLSDEFSDVRQSRDPVSRRIIPGTLFRGITPGDLAGPYLSQFLLKGNADPALDLREESGQILFGTLRIDQRQRTVLAKSDYMTDYQEWLAVQNGARRNDRDRCDNTARFIRNPRDLANYVHFDQLYEAYLNACLFMLEAKIPFSPCNPYRDSSTEAGFGTFGGPHILSLVTEVATRALKAVWYQKWSVHRRLRPEAFGGLVHNVMTERAYYPINQEILNASVVQKIHSSFGSYLLPMAFPEGSPMHPAYGAGHATVAGACVTILKAFFDESYPIQNPVIASDCGTKLVPYSGADACTLTVGGELNKLAANIAIGRNMAGVHWFSDYVASIKLGEAIAIGILQEQKNTYNEVANFVFTKFDGTKIEI